MLDNLQTHTCTKCEVQKQGGDFYWRSPERRNPWCKACYRDYYRSRKAAGVYRGVVHMEHEVSRTCDECGEAFSTGRLKRAYCSRDCKEAARKAAAKLSREQAKPERKCLHCGSAMPQSMRIDAVYCGEACNQSAHNATRKASWKAGVRQERVSRAYIIERDAGRCHLCGAYPAADELHLDHVVPLARGGSHDAANLRVACARCNLSKRADSRGEQLSLVG